MIAALRDVAARRDTRAIVIEGAGPAFSAGHDLSEMIGRDSESSWRDLFDRCSVMMQTIHEVPQPVIAKVHGSRPRLAASWWRRVTSRLQRRARASPRRVSRSACSARRRWCLYRERWVASERWRCCSRASRSTPRRRLTGGWSIAWCPRGARAAVLELVGAIARSSAYTVATGKQAFYSQIDRAEDEAYEHCELVMTENALAHDAQEGMTAFLEKRDPVWRGEFPPLVAERPAPGWDLA